MKSALLFVLISLSFFSSCSAHEWKQLFLSIEIEKEQINGTIIFDASNAVPEIRNNPTAPAKPKEWLDFLSEKAQRSIQQETTHVLKQILLFHTAEKPTAIPIQYHFPDWDTHPPQFPDLSNGFAYITVTFSIDAHRLQGVNLEISDIPLSPAVMIELSVPTKLPKMILLNPGDQFVLSTPLVDQQTTQALETNSPLWNAFLIGFQHVIPEGFDHILFILALSLSAAHWRGALRLSLLFTVAHMITFSLIYTHVIQLPMSLQGIIEWLILGSILFMALTNLKQNEQSKNTNTWLIIGFGLIHGLGFGTALQSGISPSSASLIPLLLALNAGIDSAQILIVLCSILLFFLFNKWHKLKQTKVVMNGMIALTTFTLFIMRIAESF